MYKTLKELYRRGIVTKQGLAQAVSDKVIGANDYQLITGEVYPG